MQIPPLGAVAPVRSPFRTSSASSPLGAGGVQGSSFSDMVTKGLQSVSASENQADSMVQGLAAGFVPKNYHASVVNEVRTVTDDMHETISGIAHRPDKVEVAFGVKFDSEIGAFVAKASAEAAITVTLTWGNGDEQ